MRVVAIAGSLLGVSLACMMMISCGTRGRPSFSESEDEVNPGFGDSDARVCTGLQCQQQDCGGRGETTLSGKVYAPNGTLPLYNAIVYVPNSPLEELPKGASCDKCGAVSGAPVVSAISDSSGEFVLRNVPVGKDIPLVIQVGKWRRQTTVGEVKACTENRASAELTRLPRNQSEGNIPQIALTAGGCDKVGCMLPKIGLDDTEFGVATDGPAKAVHVYNGSGGGGAAWPDAAGFWSDAAAMKSYDMIILSCECSEHLENKGGDQTGAAFGAMTEYLNAGGRIFTTDFMYSWYRYSPDPALATASDMRGGAPPGGTLITLNTAFPKGKALSDWLEAVAGTRGTIAPDTTYGNIVAVDPTKAQEWGTSGAPNAGPRIFTVNAPAGLPVEQQCGKGVHVDAHLNNGAFGGDSVGPAYPTSCTSGLRPGENLLAFFFFDLASCIQDETKPPAPPAIK